MQDFNSFQFDLKSNVKFFELVTWFFNKIFLKRANSFGKLHIKTVYDIYGCCTNVSFAILASSKHRAVTWSYRSSSYRVQSSLQTIVKCTVIRL